MGTLLQISEDVFTLNMLQVSECDTSNAMLCIYMCPRRRSVLCRNPAKVAGVGAHEQCGHSGWWPGVHHCLLPTSSSNTTPAPAVVTVSVVTHTPTCPHTASLAPDLSLQYVSHYVTVLSRSRDAREGRRAVWCSWSVTVTLCVTL